MLEILEQRKAFLRDLEPRATRSCYDEPMREMGATVGLTMARRRVRLACLRLEAYRVDDQFTAEIIAVPPVVGGCG